jgi:hypothetical protein
LLMIGFTTSENVIGWLHVLVQPFKEVVRLIVKLPQVAGKLTVTLCPVAEPGILAEPDDIDQL